MTNPAPVDELIPYVERIYRALVHLNFATADPRTRQIIRYEAATGFLVKFGRRDFVFTARHNLEGETPATTGVQIPRKLTIPLHIGQGVRRFLLAGEDVDAAVVELDPAERVLWQSAQPFERYELGTPTDSRTGRVLCLSGFPVAERTTRRGVPGMELVNDFRAAMQLVDEVPGHRSTHEPSEGRGIHVRHGGMAYDHTLGVWREVPPPNGISGGPLVAIGNDSVRVLGVARSIENGVEWCEPIDECVRLLVNHEDPEVAAEALAMVEPTQALASYP